MLTTFILAFITRNHLLLEVIILLFVDCCGLKFFLNLIQQVCNHRLAVAHSLAHGLGWHVIHYSRHVGTGPKERQGHVGGLMVKSPNGSK